MYRSHFFTHLRLLLLFLLLAFLNACAFAPKFNGPKYDPHLSVLTVDPEKKVILALTNATLDRSKRNGFDQRSKDIYTNLRHYPGYIGGKVKVEIFGDQVWTMTVWEDRESLQKFVNSTRHLDAMYMTNQAMTKFRSVNVEVPAKNLPYSWEDAQKLLKTEKYDDHKPF